MTLRLNGSTSGYVEIDAPAVAGTTSLTLPSGSGTNGQLISTNGSGVFSFVDSKILQIVRFANNTTNDISSATNIDVPGISITITPQRSNSAIIIFTSFSAQPYQNASLAFGHVSLTTSANTIISEENPVGHAGFVRDTAYTANVYFPAIIIGYNLPGTTSATTYKMRARRNDGVVRIFNVQMYAFEVAA